MEEPTLTQPSPHHHTLTQAPHHTPTNSHHTQPPPKKHKATTTNPQPQNHTVNLNLNTNYNHHLNHNPRKSCMDVFSRGPPTKLDKLHNKGPKTFRKQCKNVNKHQKAPINTNKQRRWPQNGHFRKINA